MLKIAEIRVNYEKNPIGITSIPQFGWVLESDKRSVIQSAYQLQIAMNESFEKTVYESGWVGSKESAHIIADNFMLASARKYFVRVRSRAGEEESSWSLPAFFITGFISNSEWKAEFISAESKDDADCSKGTYVRSSFEVRGKIKEAFAFTTALGLYQFYLNGKKVGKDELTPGWTSYHKHLVYQTYDVTELITEGENGIGASLGAGWYKGLMGFSGLRNHYGCQTAFLCQLILRYEDGREQIVCSDKNWIGHDSPIVFAEIYDGEVYDAKKEIPGWAQAGFQDSSWKKTEVIAYDKKVLTAQAGSRVTQMDEVKPKRIFTTPKGETVIDFGQNMTGRIHIAAGGSAGDVIELRCFEVLDKEGNVYLDNLRGAKQTLKYIFKEEGNISYHPSFTFMGFQYAEIVSFPGTPEPGNFTAYTTYSEMEPTGEFSCSNPDINQLQHNILWGMKGNFVDVPTDCPQRNERLGWTGDAQIFCRTATFLMNTYAFYKKWLKDVAADQTTEGGVAHVVPDIVSGHTKGDWLMSQGTHSAAAWADVAVINPWNMYLSFGDKEILKVQYESMKGWIDFMAKHSVDYIWNYKLQFGDWVALDAEEGSYFGATPNDLTCTAYFAYSTGLFIKILHVLEQEKEAERYQELYCHIVKKFQDTFFLEDGSMSAQTQTAHIIALYFGLTPEKYKEKTVKNLLKLLEKENGHLVTGFVGTPYFCHALSQNGHLKEAYELLLMDDFPSWLYQVKQGATTIWEHWDGKKPDGSMWSPDMNSFNHYAYGAIGEWLYRVVAGIEVDEAKPGYQHSILYPQPGGNLSFVKASYCSIYGDISVYWEEKDDCISASFQIPVNTTATICLDGKEIKEADGLAFEKQEGRFTAEAGSGLYTVIIKK